MGEDGEGVGGNSKDKELRAAIIVKELDNDAGLVKKVLRLRGLPNMEREEAEDILAQRDKEISQGKI